jgi:hypothetical protein
MANEWFGWLLISLGFASGGVLGIWFLRPEFLGGYSSPRRRLVRLGHIALIGLGVLNILFSVGASRIAYKGWVVDIASWGFMAGGVLMPLCCGLVAWRPRLRGAFVVPVFLLLLSGTITWTGMLP